MSLKHCTIHNDSRKKPRMHHLPTIIELLNVLKGTLCISKALLHYCLRPVEKRNPLVQLKFGKPRATGSCQVRAPGVAGSCQVSRGIVATSRLSFLPSPLSQTQALGPPPATFKFRTCSAFAFSFETSYSFFQLFSNT